MKKNFTLLMAMLFAVASSAFADDKLYFADFEIEPGEELDVEVLLDNPYAEYRDLQFDLYLPEGITVVQDEDEEFMVDAPRSTPLASPTQMDTMYACSTAPQRILSQAIVVIS